MKINNRILLFFVLPILAVLTMPPQFIVQGIGVVVVIAAALLTLGYLLYRGNSLTLTFTIFLQGLNVIVRMMLFFSRSVDAKSLQPDWPIIITLLVGMAISIYLVLRLDEVDIRSQLKS